MSCDWPNRPSRAVNVWFRANDDGAHAPVRPECQAGNGLARLSADHCAMVL